MKKILATALVAVLGLSVLSFAAVTPEPSKVEVKVTKTPTVKSKVAVKLKPKVHAIPVVKTTK